LGVQKTFIYIKKTLLLPEKKKKIIYETAFNGVVLTHAFFILG